MDRINVNIKTDRKDENHVYNHGGAFATKRWHNAGRTHYSEKPFNDIHWDGDTEGRHCIEIQGSNLYRVADYIPPEYIVGGLLSLRVGENEYTNPILDNMIESTGKAYGIILEGVNVFSCEAPVSGTFNVEKPGTYFLRAETEDENMVVYVNKLIFSEIVHPLSSKYLEIKPLVCELNFNEEGYYDTCELSMTYEEIVHNFKNRTLGPILIHCVSQHDHKPIMANAYLKYKESQNEIRINAYSDSNDVGSILIVYKMDGTIKINPEE